MRKGIEIGFEIQERSPFKETMVIELADGGLGYLPSPRQPKLGGYEISLTVNSVEKGASSKLVDRLIELFGRLQD